MSLSGIIKLAGILISAIQLVSGQSEIADIACNPATQPAILSDPTGLFRTQNFPRNYVDNTTCLWLIVAQPGSWVNLDFTQYTTEALFDFVYIYDGADESAPLLATFEGIYEVNPPFGVLTTQENMLVKFVADPFTNRLGFEALYTSIEPYNVVDACVPSSRPLIIENYSGTIETKNYPGNYWNNQTCVWTIHSQEAGGTVSLKFNRFYTDANSDFVFIYNGNTTASPLLARISGPREQPVTYDSNGEYLTIHFVSNWVLTRYGFTADFTSVPPAQH